MKKTTLTFLLGVLFIGGCSIGEKKQVTVNLHEVTPTSLEERSQDFVHEIAVVDPRDNKVIEVINPTQFENEEELKLKASQLATELAATIDRPMIPAKLSNGELVEGQSRMILKESVLVEQLLNKSVYNTQVVLPIEEVSPNVTKEAVAGIDEVELGSFTTYFDPSVEGRVFNIKKSAAEINEIVLGPGDRFYFNTVVGNASKANGYRLATVIVNHEFVPGYGGGVCQTSSTLYNAVAKAGLEILELHHHSEPVGYVPYGQDATVAYPYKDFKFANNRPYPIVIKTIVQGGTIEVQIRSAANYVSN
ncbi:VanW family protein [Fredinandcohnia sp. 179-A 10B2 NHS]|uniref:VanW family protein n=1 Tax=Fredinandcohnia sp. 179-A 10B2 NHS TaxID=3235176 RepID=UPI0039A1EC5F